MANSTTAILPKSAVRDKMEKRAQIKTTIVKMLFILAAVLLFIFAVYSGLKRLGIT